MIQEIEEPIQAATEADTKTSPAPEGKTWVEDPPGSGNYVLKSVAEAVKAAMQEPPLELIAARHPLKSGPIEVGNRVLIRSLGIFGTAIRVNGGVTFVETPKERARPCWEIEIEKR